MEHSSFDYIINPQATVRRKILEYQSFDELSRPSNLCNIQDDKDRDNAI
jgi:hypothetical protein